MTTTNSPPSVPLVLATRHVHPRDRYISFFEEAHVYSITDPDDTSPEKYISVTTFIHSLFPPFDADHILQKMRSSSNWTKSKYYGLTDPQILNQWEEKKNEAAHAGTQMHKAIEEYYNDLPLPMECSLELQYFQHFQDRIIVPKGYRPYRTEWCVYDIGTKIAGSIDMVYQLHEGDDVNLAIYDWKRVESIRTSNSYSTAVPPFEDIPDCNFYHYAIQLNVYRHILEKNYGKKIHELKLVVLHPSNMDFMTVDVPFLDDIVSRLLNYRATNLTETL